MTQSQFDSFNLSKLLSPVEVVRFLVSYEVATDPDVGGPIDILRATKDDACWIQHKKEGEGCETDIPECSCASARTPAPAKPTPTAKPKKPPQKRRP